MLSLGRDTGVSSRWSDALNIDFVLNRKNTNIAWQALLWATSVATNTYN